VVDHDTVCGVERAFSAANNFSLEVLPGLELTAEYTGLEIHILGYLVDHKNKPLKEKLDILKANRIKRIYRIVDKLKDMGVVLPAQSVFALAEKGTVGRLHVARAMHKEGLVASIYEAFQKYIGDKCPAYVLGFRLSPLEAIELIGNAGGIPVLAHPYTLRNDALIAQLVDFGIRGLEVYYPEHTQAMVNFYLGLAKKYNLLATGGSDYHGQAKPEVELGSVKIDYELVRKLKEAGKRND
jgi:predicted metal-dependent phosphoesterase TrpH